MNHPLPATGKKFLIIVCGPTASGKTGIAIKLAHKFSTEIISADARQFYREMHVGTASPTPEQLRAAKHHFIGSISVHDPFNVYLFEKNALALLEELYASRNVVIMAGGSGLYIDAVCKGISEMPDPDPEVREMIQQQYREQGIEFLRHQLAALDPAHFQTIDLHNPNRMIRAIEVSLTTGRPFSSFHEQPAVPRTFTPVKIGLLLPREEIISLINKRLDKMVEEGLVEEARTFYPFRSLNALNTVGYKELFEYFDGSVSLEEALGKIRRNTRRYAKRQMTWFRRDREISWFHPTQQREILLHIMKKMAE